MAVSFETFEEWHRLFDALCIEGGHLDNARLASDYCALTRKKSDTAYENALKSLSNWRQGHHTPSRRNFRILTLLLHLEATPDALACWEQLYNAAQRRETAGRATYEALHRPQKSPKSPLGNADPSAKHRRRIALSVLFIFIAVSSIFLVLNRPDDLQSRIIGIPQPAPRVIDMTDQVIEARGLVLAKIGQSVVVHGSRGRCGDPPPRWEQVLKGLPRLSNGIWSDGGVGFRVSRACGGSTPARAVVFTATRVGEERFTLYDDAVTIRVNE